jgi:hypothetical protein
MQSARFVGTLGLLLVIGLAGLVAGCGAGGESKEGGGPTDPQAAKVIEDSKRQLYKEEKQKSKAARRGGSVEGARSKPQPEP